MAKLYFYYGTMNTGKSVQLITKAYSFKSRDIAYEVIKPSTDTRSSSVKSRALSTELPCVSISPDADIYEYFTERLNSGESFKWILVDEAQFLSETQIDQLAHIVDAYSINVICYGLRTDYNTHLFPGSKRLFEIADTFEELKATCSCGNKVIVNARVDSSGNIITSDSKDAVVDCGAEDKYITLCRSCFNKAIKNIN